MIFVCVGTHRAPFDRLVSAVDAAVQDGRLPHEVVAQIGHGTYVPRGCTWFRFCERAIFEQYVTASDAVVTHGGIGTILPAARLGKRVIAVPRLARHGEHQDDHQLDICRTLAHSGAVELVENPEDIAETLGRAVRPAGLAPRGTLVRELRAMLGMLARGAPDWLSNISGPVDLIAVLAGDKPVRHPAARALAGRFPDAAITITGEHEHLDAWAGTRVIACPRQTRSTREDLLAIRDLAVRRGYSSIVLVTSMLHGRRVFHAFPRAFGGTLCAVQVAAVPAHAGRVTRGRELLTRVYYRARGWA